MVPYFEKMNTREEENPVLRTIIERRSVRKYKEQKVPRGLLEKVIEAGNHAPSVDNLQPWRFVVVEDEGVKEKLRKVAVPRWRSIIEGLKESDPDRFQIFGKFMGVNDPVYFSAPVIIFVIGPSGVNCALACENMMLAAHALGLGSCYAGWGTLSMEDPDLRQLFMLEEKERVFGPILVGYPEKIPLAPEKKVPNIKWF